MSLAPAGSIALRRMTGSAAMLSPAARHFERAITLIERPNGTAEPSHT